MHRSEIMQLRGDWADAMAEVRQACERLSEPAGDPTLGMALYQQGELPFQVADPDRLRNRLEQAGLIGVQIETITRELTFGSGTELFETVSTSNPIGAAQVADLTTEQRAEVMRVLDGMLRERSAGGPGGLVTSEVHIGIGTKRHPPHH